MKLVDIIAGPQDIEFVVCSYGLSSRISCPAPLGGPSLWPTPRWGCRRPCSPTSAGSGCRKSAKKMINTVVSTFFLNIELVVDAGRWLLWLEFADVFVYVDVSQGLLVSFEGNEWWWRRKHNWARATDRSVMLCDFWQALLLHPF